MRRSLLLRAGGEPAAAQILNRRGNRCLKFYALLEMVPLAAHRLSPAVNELLLRLRRLTDWVSLGQAGALNLGELSFDGR